LNVQLKSMLKVLKSGNVLLCQRRGPEQNITGY
jgi:hypothetical protein